jgi:hypothetical protein
MKKRLLVSGCYLKYGILKREFSCDIAVANYDLDVENLYTNLLDVLKEKFKANKVLIRNISTLGDMRDTKEVRNEKDV